jgi:hypothetical protein
MRLSARHAGLLPVRAIKELEAEEHLADLLSPIFPARTTSAAKHGGPASSMAATRRADRPLRSLGGARRCGLICLSFGQTF